MHATTSSFTALHTSGVAAPATPTHEMVERRGAPPLWLWRAGAMQIGRETRVLGTSKVPVVLTPCACAEAQREEDARMAMWKMRAATRKLVLLALL